MRLIYKGAEAELYREKWLGMDVVRKVRTKKPYKHPELDERLRNARVRNEARMLSRAREAVNTPHVLFVNESEIIMGHVPGEKVKNLFLAGKTASAKSVGKAIRSLHDSGIVHNDLTTSNMIVRNGKVWLIDFGLAQVSSSAEDRATDLMVFKRMLGSTHYDVFGKVWKRVLEGYSPTKEIAAKMAEIEKRAKYR